MPATVVRGGYQRVNGGSDNFMSRSTVVSDIKHRTPSSDYVLTFETVSVIDDIQSRKITWDLHP